MTTPLSKSQVVASLYKKYEKVLHNYSTKAKLILVTMTYRLISARAHSTRHITWYKIGRRVSESSIRAVQNKREKSDLFRANVFNKIAVLKRLENLLTYHLFQLICALIPFYRDEAR